MTDPRNAREAMFRAALDSANQTMNAEGGIETMILAHNAAGRLYAYNLSSATAPVLKDAAAASIGVEMRRNNVVAYTMMSEAWFVETQTASQPVDQEAGISQHPDRIEVLVLAVSDRDGDEVRTYRLLRNKRGRFVRFESLPLPDDESVTAEGRFLGLLRQPVMH